MDALRIMQRLGQGKTLDEWGAALKEVAQSVSETGKPGSITLTVEVRPLGGQGGLEVGLKETVKRSMPKTGERGALLFVFDGDFYTSDPRQPGLPTMTVVGDTIVNATTGEIVERPDDGRAEEAI